MGLFRRTARLSSRPGLSQRASKVLRLTVTAGLEFRYPWIDWPLARGKSDERILTTT